MKFYINFVQEGRMAHEDTIRSFEVDECTFDRMMEILFTDKSLNYKIPTTA